ncbi:MAG: hypothetical protein GC185_04505 [Alphaproteobacteria bacterium]|nr:hypothetical protein [Alphaproteobacteria bacterium]
MTQNSNAASFNAPAGKKLKRIPGFIVDKRDEGGMTMLMECARQNLIAETIQCLDEGSDINAKDKAGLTPLLHALLNGKPDVAVLLANKGADLTVKTAQGMNALMLACQQQRGGKMTEVIETLIRRGSPLDERGHLTCMTALHHAINNRDIWAAERLICAGADFDTIGNKFGHTAEKTGLQTFSDKKDRDFFTSAIEQRRTAAARAAQEEADRRENELRQTVAKATVLQREVTRMKPLTLRRKGQKPPGG